MTRCVQFDPVDGTIRQFVQLGNLNYVLEEPKGNFNIRSTRQLDPNTTS